MSNIGKRIEGLTNDGHVERTGEVVEETETRIRVQWPERRTWLAKNAEGKRWRVVPGGRPTADEVVRVASLTDEQIEVAAGRAAKDCDASDARRQIVTEHVKQAAAATGVHREGLNPVRNTLRAAIMEALRRMALAEQEIDDAGMLQWANEIEETAGKLRRHAEEHGL